MSWYLPVRAVYLKVRAELISLRGKPPQMLDVILSIDQKVASNDLVTLTFQVRNKSSEESAKFCTYHTPFEGFANDIFTITYLATSEEIPYQGIMASRVAPGPDDWVELSPLAERHCRINLSEAYDFSRKGIYEIRYPENGVSELPRSNKIRVTII